MGIDHNLVATVAPNVCVLTWLFVGGCACQQEALVFLRPAFQGLRVKRDKEGREVSPSKKAVFRTHNNRPCSGFEVEYRITVRKRQSRFFLVSATLCCLVMPWLNRPK